MDSYILFTYNNVQKNRLGVISWLIKFYFANCMSAPIQERAKNKEHRLLLINVDAMAAGAARADPPHHKTKSAPSVYVLFYA